MKIFLSAVDPALADIRQNIAQTFGSWDHEVITAEDLPQTLQTDRQERDARVCSADVFVAIYAQRYGEVPQGEHLSLQEVDYRKALEAGKEVFCFTLSPEVNWPESEIEDDFVKKQRLDDLIADMRKRPENHQYQTAADIRSYLKPRIKKLTLVYDRVKLLQQWAAEQSTDSKYQHLTQLADRLGAEKLSEPDFARAASLILRNFDTRDVKPANPLFDDVERFLKNDLSADGLVDKCRTVTRHSWKEVFANYLPWSLVASVVLFLGLGLWAGSWFGGFTARSNDAALARILEKEVPPAPALADLAGESGRPIREALAFVAGQNPDHPALGAIMAQLSDSLQVAMGSAADSTGLVALYSQLNDWCGEGALPLFCEKASLLKTRLAAHQQEAAAREVLAEIRSGGSSGEARAARYRAFLKNYPDFPEAATVRRELAEVEQAVAAEVSKARQDSLDRLKSLAEAGEKARQDSLANLARAAQKAREDSLKALAAARETARRDSLALLAAAREARETARRDSLSRIAAQNTATPAPTTAQTPSVTTPAATSPQNTTPIAQAPAQPPAQPESSGDADSSESIAPPVNQVAVSDPALQSVVDQLNEPTVTLEEKLSRWRAIAQSSPAGSNSNDYAMAELERLEFIKKNTATLDDPLNFVTAADVNRDTYMPEGESDTFQPGKVWMWARMNAPRVERIYARWYSNGRVTYTSQARISRPSGAYRIYFTRTYSENNIGPAEVRLYNEDDILIGRKTFEITPPSVTQDQGMPADSQ